MTQARLDEYAKALSRAFETGEVVDVPSQHGDELSIEEAFEVQAAVAERRAEGGSTRIRGFKAGLTDPVFTGRVLAHDVVFHGGTIDAASLFEPVVEPELAFVLGAPLGGDDLTIADVLQATDFVLPAFEIVDKRLSQEGARTTSDVIADNGNFGKAVFGGSSLPVSELDPSAMVVDLLVDGRRVGSGRGDQATAHPAHAVILVARLLHRVGLSFEPGQAVLTGSCIVPHPLANPGKVEAHFHGLGRVEVTFA